MEKVRDGIYNKDINTCDEIKMEEEKWRKKEDA